MVGMKPRRRKFYGRPKFRNPGHAWDPRTPRQERKYKTPRAFTTRAQWKYGDNRTEEREQRIKYTALQLLGVGEFFNGIVRRILPRWKPERIESNKYVVEG